MLINLSYILIKRLEKDVKISFPMFNVNINVTPPDVSDAEKRRRKHRRKQKQLRNENNDAEDATAAVGTIDAKAEGKEEKEPKKRPLVVGDKQPVLMVETENIQHDNYKQTEEIKALTQEVIKTIRDIITMNPLYRESLQQMLHQNQRVVDNPVYLCDLGASLSAADPPDLQAIMEEMDVSTIHCYC